MTDAQTEIIYEHNYYGSIHIWKVKKETPKTYQLECLGGRYIRTYRLNKNELDKMGLGNSIYTFDKQKVLECAKMAIDGLKTQLALREIEYKNNVERVNAQ